MLDERGREVGRHVGLSFYTLGQRQGLGIGGVRAGGGAHAPWYVAAKDVAHNALYVVQGHAHPWLAATALRAEDPSWIAGRAPTALAVGAKARYRQADAAARLRLPAQQRDGGTQAAAGFALDFEQPQWAVTPGQSAVLYEGEVCLGGGVITQATVPGMPAALPRPVAARRGPQRGRAAREPAASAAAHD
jgi:tRNA-specific 2-thiouridylase